MANTSPDVLWEIGFKCRDLARILKLQKLQKRLESTPLGYMCPVLICKIDVSLSYLIFVIFFTHAKFLENKIYTEIYTVNCQFTQ